MVLISRQSPGLPWTPGYDGASTQAGKDPCLGGACVHRNHYNWSCFVLRAEGMARDIMKGGLWSTNCVFPTDASTTSPTGQSPGSWPPRFPYLKARGSLPPNDAAALCPCCQKPPPLQPGVTHQMLESSLCPLLPSGVEISPLPISGPRTHSSSPIVLLPPLGLALPLCLLPNTLKSLGLEVIPQVLTRSGPSPSPP